MPNIENISNIKGGDLMGQVRGDDDRVNATSAPIAGEGDLVIFKEHGEWAPSTVSKLPNKRTFSSIIVKITHENHIFMRERRKGMQYFFIKALWFTRRGINCMKLYPPAIDEDLNRTVASNFFPMFKPIKIVVSDRKMVFHKKTNPRHKLIDLDHFAGAFELR